MQEYCEVQGGYRKGALASVGNRIGTEFDRFQARAPGRALSTLLTVG
jgi:hypothetical protein